MPPKRSDRIGTGQHESGTVIDVIQCGTLGIHAAAWDALVSFGDPPTPFLRSWWLEAVAGPRPVFLLVIDGGTLLGGLALEEDHGMVVRRLRFIGDRPRFGDSPLGPDHLDAV